MLDNTFEDIPENKHFCKKTSKKLAGIMIHWPPMRKQAQKCFSPSSKLLGKEVIEKAPTFGLSF